MADYWENIMSKGKDGKGSRMSSMTGLDISVLLLAFAVSIGATWIAHHRVSLLEAKMQEKQVEINRLNQKIVELNLLTKDVLFNSSFTVREKILNEKLEKINHDWKRYLNGQEATKATLFLPKSISKGAKPESPVKKN